MKMVTVIVLIRIFYGLKTYIFFYLHYITYTLQEERRNWILQLKGVSLSSDAFFPFRDNIDRAALVSIHI